MPLANVNGNSPEMECTSREMLSAPLSDLLVERENRSTDESHEVAFANICSASPSWPVVFRERADETQEDPANIISSRRVLMDTQCEKSHARSISSISIAIRCAADAISVDSALTGLAGGRYRKIFEQECSSNQITRSTSFKPASVLSREIDNDVDRYRCSIEWIMLGTLL